MNDFVVGLRLVLSLICAVQTVGSLQTGWSAAREAQRAARYARTPETWRDVRRHVAMALVSLAFATLAGGCAALLWPWGLT